MVWGLMAGLQGTQAMRVVCLSGGWLWNWKPLDDPGTHYPQAIQLLNAVKCNLTKLTTIKSAVSV